MCQQLHVRRGFALQCLSLFRQLWTTITYSVTYVYIGWPGSVHDARVFAHSSLYKKVKAESILKGASVQIQSQDISPFLIGNCISPVTMAHEAFSHNGSLSDPEKGSSTTY